MKPFILLFIFSFFYFSTNLTAQNKDSFLIEYPNHELSVSLGLGSISQITYYPTKGKSIFTPAHDMGVEGSLSYAHYLSPRDKFSLGFLFGTSSFSSPYKIKPADFPGIDTVFSANSFYLEDYGMGVFQRDYPNIYFAIPLKYHFRLLEINANNTLWANIGIDLTYYFPIGNSTSFSVGVDTTYYTIYRMNFTNNKESKITYRLSTALEYRYKLNNNHQLYFGLNYSMNFHNVLTGEYEILPFSTTYIDYGILTSRLNLLSLNLGYSINNQTQKSPRIKNKKSTPKQKLIIPDSIPKNNAWRFDINLFNRSKIKISQNENMETPLEFSTYGNFHMGFSALWLRYLTKTTAFYTGIRYQLTQYDYYIHFKKELYPFLDDDAAYFLNDVNSYLRFPVGINQEHKISKKLSLEFGGNFFIDLPLEHKPNSYSSFFIIGQHLGRENFRVSYSGFRWLNSGLSAHIALSYFTHRQNNLNMGLRYNQPFLPSYSETIYILQPNGDFKSAKITMQAKSFEIYINYTFFMRYRKYKLKMKNY